MERNLKPMRNHERRTFRLVQTLFLAALLFLSACSPESADDEAEQIYFTTLTHKGLDTERHVRMSFAPQVYRYDGGDTYQLVFELPSKDDYETRIFNSSLYYGLSSAGYKNDSIELRHVDLENGVEELCAVIPCKRLWSIEADDGGVYALAELGDEYCIYRLNDGRLTELVREPYIAPERFSVGGGYVFYISGSGKLMRIDAESLEKTIIDEVLTVAHTAYDNERIYVSFTHCYSYSAKGGEPCLETADESLKKHETPPEQSLSIGIPAVHDGWIYHRTVREGYTIEVRNRDTDEKRAYSLDFPIGFYALEDVISFGAHGFIINDAEHSDSTLEGMNRYYYYPYEGGEGIAIELI